jgi:putative acetyltransferase
VFIIRRAREEDCEGIARLHSRAVREIAHSHYTPEEIAAWERPHELRVYVEAVQNKQFYVAEEYGAVIGFGTLNDKQNEIEAVYVSPQVVRRGVASAILLQLEERARELGIQSLKLDASLNAVPFYKSAGYETQKEMKHRLASGVDIDCVVMTKEL